MSWHPLQELGTVIDQLQGYIDEFTERYHHFHISFTLSPPFTYFISSTKSNDANTNAKLEVLGNLSLKRKSPHDESTSSSSSSTAPAHTLPTKSKAWNGVLLRKSGDIYPMHVDNGHRIDATTLPTLEMRAAAAAHGPDGIKQAKEFIRGQFKFQLARIPGPAVTFSNHVDKEIPPAFTWITDYVYGPGVTKTDADAVMLGCTKCRPDMGGNKGCEYTQKCDCLEYAHPDPKRLKDDQVMQYAAWEEGLMDAAGLPKRFPYRMVDREYVLDPFYLESRKVIYECNPRCKCGPHCKNRKVQHGRKVPLEIFKTAKRGFGLRCPVPLKRGQFIDKYLGELITDDDANKREASSGPGKASYLFSLDKFANDDGQPGSLRSSDCYVADGEHMGGPTRFINHSCDPNCRLFTVSYNRFDTRIYDLAFFALHDIPANEELTFDYMDPEEGEAGQAEKADVEGKEDGIVVDCLCGAENCRGKLWM